ncbi:Phosphorylase kinase [Candidatus Electronema halotolerans]
MSINYSIVAREYSSSNLKDIFDLLTGKDSFLFPLLDNGLFPAANLQTESEYTGYNNVWIRDNIHIAYAHYLNGKTDIAIKNITAFTDYFIKHQWRFEKIIAGELDFNDPMNRPHIRFNGNDLSEIKQKWAHAENDALGYFLWLFCKLYNEHAIAELNAAQTELLALFALYFDKIAYWQDEDSGHWEEVRKVEASSIGVVVAALIELNKIIGENRYSIHCKDKIITSEFVTGLIAKGQEALNAILPAECIQPEKYRRYDAALLFLIFPLNVVSEEIADQILNDVRTHLQGDYGIRRYLGDSYWSADYKEKVKEEERTIDVSDNIAERDSLLQSGQEAQWCIFDPVMSIIYGMNYQKTHDKRFLQLQIDYFNRSLSQLTPEDSRFGGFKCPELYYLEHGQYIPGDTTPLLWTQANFWMAFNYMERSMKIKAR